MRQSNRNGRVLYSDDNVTVIVTGLSRKSENVKTGPMLQVFILQTGVSPLDGVKTGSDYAICGNCPHRRNPITGKRSCYVNVGQSPQNVWISFKSGAYAPLAIEDYGTVFNGKRVRLGAYGDPAFIPQNIVSAICSSSAKWAGYTHQWKRAEWLKPYTMASVDSPAEQAIAAGRGWRTFRVNSDNSPIAGEIRCPSSPEGGDKVQCYNCCLCHGAGSERNITIQVHGSGKANFVSLASLTARS